MCRLTLNVVRQLHDRGDYLQGWQLDNIYLSQRQEMSYVPEHLDSMIFRSETCTQQCARARGRRGGTASLCLSYLPQAIQRPSCHSMRPLLLLQMRHHSIRQDTQVLCLWRTHRWTVQQGRKDLGQEAESGAG